MTSRELTARQKKNSHDKVSKARKGHKSHNKKVDSCFMTGFGVRFLDGKEEEEKMAKREEREKEKRFLLFHFPNYSSSSNT